MTPAAATPSAIGGLRPTSHWPVRTNSSQLATPAARTSIRTSSSARGRGSGRSIVSTGWSRLWIPATCILTLDHGTGDEELAMKPVTVAIEVPQAREQVYDLLDILRNHEQFTDHFLVDWELSGPPSGAGARARMQVKSFGIKDPLEMKVVAAERPR